MDDLNKIRSSNVYLLSLVNDVLDISKIDSNAVELHPEVYRYSDYTANIRNIFEPLCQEKNLKFTIEGRSCNRPVIADRTRLDQITLNLVSNAVKYTPPGGEIALLVTGRDMGSEIAVTIEVRDTGIGMNLLSNAIKFTPAGGAINLTLETRGEETNLAHDRFILRDTGVGMSREFMQTGLFHPFSQEHNSLTTQYAGSGLGLAIVKNLVELMHENVFVNNDV